MAHANRKRVALYLTDKQIEKISMYSEELDISKQQVMSNIIDVGLDDLALLKRTGFLMIGKGFRNLVYKLRKTEFEDEEDSFNIVD